MIQGSGFWVPPPNGMGGVGVPKMSKSPEASTQNELMELIFVRMLGAICPFWTKMSKLAQASPKNELMQPIFSGAPPPCAHFGPNWPNKQKHPPKNDHGSANPPIMVTTVLVMMTILMMMMMVVVMMVMVMMVGSLVAMVMVMAMSDHGHNQ